MLQKILTAYFTEKSKPEKNKHGYLTLNHKIIFNLYLNFYI